jgi:hypothetical protein
LVFRLPSQALCLKVVSRRHSSPGRRARFPSQPLQLPPPPPHAHNQQQCLSPLSLSL